MTRPAGTAVPDASRVEVRVLLLVAVGGAIGALLRWSWGELGSQGPGAVGTTLAANVCGCFLLGVLPAVRAVRRSVRLSALLGPGFLGGFTTVSAWAVESRELAASGALAGAGAYVAGTLALCVAAAAAGRLVAAALIGRAP